MGVTETAVIEIKGDLAEMLAKSTAMHAMQFDSRPEIKTEENNIKFNALNIEKQMAKNKPTISAYGNYSLLQLNKNPNFFASDTWFPFNFLGVKLNMPIFNGKQSALNAVDYKIQQEINRNDIQKLKEDFEQEAKTSKKLMAQATLDLEQTKKNIKLAESIYGIDKFRFEKGVITYADLITTEYSLKQAENNYLNAAYNFLQAELKFRKATGNL
jgi:outer membrane protein